MDPEWWSIQGSFDEQYETPQAATPGGNSQMPAWLRQKKSTINQHSGNASGQKMSKYSRIATACKTKERLDFPLCWLCPNTCPGAQPTCRVLSCWHSTKKMKQLFRAFSSCVCMCKFANIDVRMYCIDTCAILIVCVWVCLCVCVCVGTPVCLWVSTCVVVRVGYRLTYTWQNRTTLYYPITYTTSNYIQPTNSTHLRHHSCSREHTPSGYHTCRVS